METKLILKLLEDEKLTKAETNLVERLNSTLVLLTESERCSQYIINLEKAYTLDEKTSDVFSETLRNIFQINFDVILQYFDEIKVEWTDADQISFDPNVHIYDIDSSYKQNIMPMLEFKRFISENKISTIFKSVVADTFVQTGLSVDDIENFLCKYSDTNYFILQPVCEEAIKTDLAIFNSILSKVNQNACASKLYICNYNGFVISAINETNLSNIPADVLVGLICFHNLEKIIAMLAKQRIDRIAEREIYQREYEERKKEKLAQIRKRIMGDSNFMKATTSKLREGFLKKIMRDETDEALSFLDMSRRSNGVIVFNGITAPMFINEIWEEMTTKKE